MIRSVAAAHRSWSLLGEAMSVKCIACLLGIRSDRIKRSGSGMLDRRYACHGAEPGLYF